MKFCLLRSKTSMPSSLSPQSSCSGGQVVHVFEWKPIKKIKEALLSQCLVWVEFIDLPSFLWLCIKEITASLGQLTE